MTIWIKICGLTTEDAVAAATAAGADAIGFVLAPSRRQVSAQRAAQLARHAADRVTRVAVMQHPAQSLLDEVWSVFHPDVLQTDFEDLQTLQLPPGLRVMPVLRSGRQRPALVPQRLLFEGPTSGAGQTADWSAAGELSRSTELVLAGGLTAHNVAQAISAVRPYGVDVSSGVESAPGIKDADKIHEFVRRARAAATGASR